MKHIITAIAVAVAAIFAVVVSAPSAAAGSDNGTNNWYATGSCSTTGGRLDITNYDKIISGSVWQEYHIDADRAGGVGNAPKVYIQQSGTTTWSLLSYWNDFYIQIANQWLEYNFRANFSNGSQCYIIGL